MKNSIFMSIIFVVTFVTTAAATNQSWVVTSQSSTNPNAAFVPPTRRDHGPSNTELHLSMRSNKRGTTVERHANTPRFSRHHGEVAGITSGLGLWREIRQRVRRRARRKRQQIYQEKWIDSGGERRLRKLNMRFRRFNLGAGNSSNIREDATTNAGNDYDDEFNDFSLDACIARAGVLRTGIRLRQEELKDLEQLMKDLQVELRRAANRKKRLQEAYFVVDTNSTDESQGESVEDMESLMNEFQLDLMEKRSAELQSIILLDRVKLQRLERRITCFESSELGIIETAVGNTIDALNDLDNPISVMQRQAKKFANTFGESTSVLLRKIDRVSNKRGRSNRSYSSVTDYVVQETAAGVRIVGSLLSNPDQLSHLIDPDTPTLVPHIPAILTRLDRLESHVGPILSRVLNNKQHLRTIEPYLPEILERFDDIEPHLPWILDHIDTLAPYTGLLLKHIDELLLYAAVDEHESGGNKDDYAFAEQLLPYLELYVSQLDLVGPHLPLLRPHLPILLKHNRIKILSPHVGVLFSKGYKDLSGKINQLKGFFQHLYFSVSD
ncbi:hypothetical protein ACHAXS_006573 [Conticribra weissflogii]